VETSASIDIGWALMDESVHPGVTPCLILGERWWSETVGDLKQLLMGLKKKIEGDKLRPRERDSS
jgi:hypothetical protein